MSTPGASSEGLFEDPLEEISKLSKSRSTKAGVSSESGDVFGDIDSLIGQRDLQNQKEQEERQRVSVTLDVEIKRWVAGKEGNLRSMLSSLQYILWPECGWQFISLTDLIPGASVKEAYRKATLCIHTEKVQQKGATIQQKYVAEKVFDLLKKKEFGKRTKDDSRRHRDKKERAMDLLAKPSAHTTNQGNGLPYAQSAISIDSDDGISYKDIGGLAGQLLEENAQALKQISANFSSFKVHENISLISQTRNNIVSILNDLNDAPEIMKRMPPLPMKLNDELVDSILLQSSMPIQF